jgi:hypothetical protein
VRRNRFSVEKIVAVLKQAELAMAVPELIRKVALLRRVAKPQDGRGVGHRFAAQIDADTKALSAAESYRAVLHMPHRPGSTSIATDGSTA